MKKVLSLLLAVVLVCSMATVAFAATTGQGYDCPQEGCEFWTDDYADMQAHIAGGCNRYFRPCQYGCGNGFANEAEKADHELDCWYGSMKCDYCGKDFNPMRNYVNHIDACKKSRLYIPLALIIEHVKAFFGKLDFQKIIADGKSFFGYVGTIGKDVAGAIK